MASAAPIKLYFGERQVVNNDVLTNKEASEPLSITPPNFRAKFLTHLLVNISTDQVLYYVVEQRQQTPKALVYVNRSGDAEYLPKNFPIPAFSNPSLAQTGPLAKTRDRADYVYYLFDSSDITEFADITSGSDAFKLRFSPSRFGSLIDKIKFRVQPGGIPSSLIDELQSLPQDLKRYIASNEAFNIYDILDICPSLAFTANEESIDLCDPRFWRLVVELRLTQDSRFLNYPKIVHLQELAQAEYYKKYYTASEENSYIGPYLDFEVFIPKIINDIDIIWNLDYSLNVQRNLYDTRRILKYLSPSLIDENTGEGEIFKSVIPKLTNRQFKISFNTLLVNRYNQVAFNVMLDELKNRSKEYPPFTPYINFSSANDAQVNYWVISNLTTNAEYLASAKSVKLQDLIDGYNLLANPIRGIREQPTSKPIEYFFQFPVLMQHYFETHSILETVYQYLDKPKNFGVINTLLRNFPLTPQLTLALPLSEQKNMIYSAIIEQLTDEQFTRELNNLIAKKYNRAIFYLMLQGIVPEERQKYIELY
jgi:hypothetical protein